MKKFFKNTIVRTFLLITFILMVIGGYLYGERILNIAWGFYHVHKADSAYARGDLKNTVKYYTIALKEFPEHSQARCNLANIYVSFEDYTSAIEQYKLALKYKPDFMTCRMDLGIIEAEKLAEFDAAIDEYQKVADTSRFPILIPLIYDNTEATRTNKGYAYYNMGLAYRSKAQFVPREKLKNNLYLIKAVEAYNKAAKNNKNDYDTYFNLALTHHLLGNTKEAGLTYCKAIEIKPLNYEAHFNLAILLDSLKYYKNAIEEFNKAGALLGGQDQMQGLYLNDLVNETYKKNAIQMQLDIENGISGTDENPELIKSEKKVILKEDYIKISDGKIKLKEEKPSDFKAKMKKCEAKTIFKGMN